MSRLGKRLLGIHAALDKAALPHAFGGAIALAYCTQEPRGTRDLDVNIFVGPERAEEVFDVLPRGVTVTAAQRKAVRSDAQVRVFWYDTPLGLFFDAHDFHRDIAKDVQHVPFEGTTIPVLGCEALVIFKAMYNRTRDWADIEAVLEAGAVDCARALDKLRSLLKETDPAVVRLAALCDLA